MGVSFSNDSMVTGARRSGNDGIDNQFFGVEKLLEGKGRIVLKRTKEYQ